MTSEQEINQLKSRIKAHRAMIESLRTRIKEIEADRPYGSTKGAWLKTVKFMTSPFASANKNVTSYMNDPDLYELHDLFEDAEKFLKKVHDQDEKLHSKEHVEKFLEQLTKIQEAILKNSAYISTRYSEESGEQFTKILSKLEQVKALLNNQKRLLEFKQEEKIEITETEAVEFFHELDNIVTLNNGFKASVTIKPQTT